MSDGVKRRTRVSRKNQVTIPVGVLEEAGLSAGETVEVEASGPGRVTVTRLDALLERYRGALEPGAVTNQQLERLRDEWG